MKRAILWVIEILCWAFTLAFFAIAFFLSTTQPVGAAEVFAGGGQGSWSRCSGSACWDQSGDPSRPLPVTWNTHGNTWNLGARLGEFEAAFVYAGPGKRVVDGNFVDDQYFDPATRTVVGCPPRVIHAQVDQWTAGVRAVWAPRWEITDGVHLQPELGVFAHHTRWAITWLNQGGARGDGGSWSATPTGGARLVFEAQRDVMVATGFELYHRPTVQTAPLGGGGRKAPGLAVTVLELRLRIR